MGFVAMLLGLLRVLTGEALTDGGTLTSVAAAAAVVLLAERRRGHAGRGPVAGRAGAGRRPGRDAAAPGAPDGLPPAARSRRPGQATPQGPGRGPGGRVTTPFSTAVHAAALRRSLMS